jgi:hypothetical protein
MELRLKYLAERSTNHLSQKNYHTLVENPVYGEVNIMHTKGPWKLLAWSDRIEVTTPDDGFFPQPKWTIWNGIWQPPSMREEQLANAHLIAAAPELLEALKNLLQAMKNLHHEQHDSGIVKLSGRYKPIMDFAERVIAKAIGSVQ